MGIDPAGLRLQRLDEHDQVLSVAQLAETRSASGLFGPTDLDAIFDAIGLPRPKKMSNNLEALKRRKLLTHLKGKRGAWKLTPEGRALVNSLLNKMDLAAIAAEMEQGSTPVLAGTPHPVIAPQWAPPDLVGPLRVFLDEYPFETNVFGMTRFPGDDDADPVASALDAARDVCTKHGFSFHLASDRQIVDDLWQNVAAHMWACHYGIAFIENRAKKGLNYNLTIEVGAMFALGRRTALLKDKSIPSLPTDLVGKIYKPVDLDDPSTVRSKLEEWFTSDLPRK